MSGWWSKIEVIQVLGLLCTYQAGPTITHHEPHSKPHNRYVFLIGHMSFSWRAAGVTPNLSGPDDEPTMAPHLSDLMGGWVSGAERKVAPSICTGWSKNKSKLETHVSNALLKKFPRPTKTPAFHHFKHSQP